MTRAACKHLAAQSYPTVGQDEWAGHVRVYLAYAVCANDWSKEERTVETSDGRLKKLRKEQKMKAGECGREDGLCEKSCYNRKKGKQRQYPPPTPRACATLQTLEFHWDAYHEQG